MDQDPVLMRDFRTIRKFEVDWKEAQNKQQAAKNAGPVAAGGQQPQSLSSVLDNFIKEQGIEDGHV